MSLTMHVVSHTHWDREWYLTFQQFRLRLVDLIDHLLDLLDRDPDFLSFHLDAQTIVLEDYLEIKPYNRPRLESYIRAGRIIVGPWYQLNDEFLTSGEATVRSLLIGSRIARRFGACASIGYLPDQFGNISQMPQIFRGFGIDNAILGRGYQLADDRKMEFIWEGPDGSRVTASLMAFWYNNAQHFPADPDEALGYIERLVDLMSPVSVVSHLLLMNGVDHLEPQQDLSPILRGLNERLPQGPQIVHSTVEEYVRAVQKEAQARGIALNTYTGELREDRGGSCLAGTLSARMYLKQANDHAQITLEKYAEPFASFALQVGVPYPQEYLHYVWKLLMKNHPHDSICGCSIDQVHREMLPRFAQVEQIGEEWAARSLQAIAGRVDYSAFPHGENETPGATGLVVFNSLSWSRTDPVRAALVFPLGEPTRGNPPRDDSRKVAGITIMDEAGRAVPFAVIDQAAKMRAVLSPVELPLDQWVQEILVEFIAEEVPACGYKAYRITPTAAMPGFPVTPEIPQPRWQPVLEDVGDVGDEYLYRAPAHDRRVVQPILSIPVSEEVNAVRRTQIYSSALDLPAAASSDGESRSSEQAACPVSTRLTGWRGIPRLEFVTTIENRARDHRLRVWFQNQAGAFHARPYSIAQGAFDVLRRPLDNPLVSEGASPFYPHEHWVALEGGYGSEEALETITVISQGLPEYEIYPGQGGEGIALTLLRCVNYLSRRGDGPQLETPEAQCPGEHTFRYAVLESGGSWEKGKVWRQAWQFNAPLAAVQTEIHPEPGLLPAVHSFITVEPDTLVVTAIKRVEDAAGTLGADTLIIRFYNISEAPVSGGTVAVYDAVAAHVVNLNEEDPQPLDLQDGKVSLAPVGPKEIVTLAFKLR